MDIRRALDEVALLARPLAQPGGQAAVAPLPLAAAALLARALHAGTGRTVAVVADGLRTLELVHQDLCTLAPPGDGARPLFLPPWEPPAVGGEAADTDLTSRRFDALRALAASAAPGARGALAATTVRSLMQRTLAPETLRAQTPELVLGAELDRDALLAALAATGYEVTVEVQAPGQAAAKGGVLDVWPITEPWPVRAELFGPQLDSLRTFDPVSQRSRDRIARVALPPAGEWKLLSGLRGAALAADYLPPDAIVIWLDRAAAAEHAALYEEAAREAGFADAVLPLAALDAALAARPALSQVAVGGDRGGDGAPEAGGGSAAADGILRLPFEPLPVTVCASRAVPHPDIQEQIRQRLAAELQARLDAGETVAVFLETQGARDHFAATLPAAMRDRVDVRPGGLSGGFVCPALRAVVVAECDLYGRREALGRRYQPDTRPGPDAADVAGSRVENLADLQPGDLVVHVEHGLGRYQGLHDIVFGGRRQEVLTVEYAEGARLHIPVSQAHLLSRYIGVGGHQVRLHRLGGRRWKRERAEAEEAVADLASSLLQTQAERNLLRGHAFRADTVWQHEFEASFPYRETGDQSQSIAQVRSDMESRRPMDRLICGDAGYGKTEVAMRAAFKAVMDQKQVAVLVPTTVLAQQHYQTFAERMAPYPVRIEMLSRFRSAGARAQVLRGMAEGTVDIVIGTHGLLQPGVRFRDLGLVIIDEEQRFGVQHKERLKDLRRLVDVLTMTATPIPRTLYLSLTGTRNISLLQTPPRERMAIETIVARGTDELVRKAILREVNRDGQVFYLHNRVMSIDFARERLEQLVPEVRLVVAHGQMATAELEAAMQRFIAGECEVLLCTTIIESGVDIPRANTILIDRADRFGIAELYQLRGRVGRSNRKAYAYLLLPAKGRIDALARERIAAIETHSGLGSGFNLALRDLEIRGAGNILGAEQSGHIAAVGFGLYCQLLRRTVARLQGKPLPVLVDVAVNLDFISLSPLAADDPGAAAVPYTYVEDEQLRVDVYRRIAETAALPEVEHLAAELADRFGPPPAPVRRLLTLAAIRVCAAVGGLRVVETRDDRLMLRDAEDYVMRNHRFPRLEGATPDEKLDEVLRLVRTVRLWRRG